MVRLRTIFAAASSISRRRQHDTSKHWRIVGMKMRVCSEIHPGAQRDPASAEESCRRRPTELDLSSLSAVLAMNLNTTPLRSPPPPPSRRISCVSSTETDDSLPHKERLEQNAPETKQVLNMKPKVSRCAVSITSTITSTIKLVLRRRNLGWRQLSRLTLPKRCPMV